MKDVHSKRNLVIKTKCRGCGKSIGKFEKNQVVKRIEVMKSHWEHWADLKREEQTGDAMCGKCGTRYPTSKMLKGHLQNCVVNRKVFVVSDEKKVITKNYKATTTK